MSAEILFYISAAIGIIGCVLSAIGSFACMARHGNHEALRVAVQKSAAKFREYEAQHIAKAFARLETDNDQEAYIDRMGKARENGFMVLMCEEALGEEPR